MQDAPSGDFFERLEIRVRRLEDTTASIEAQCRRIESACFRIEQIVGSTHGPVHRTRLPGTPPRIRSPQGRHPYGARTEPGLRAAVATYPNLQTELSGGPGLTATPDAQAREIFATYPFLVQLPPAAFRSAPRPTSSRSRSPRSG